MPVPDTYRNLALEKKQEKHLVEAQGKAALVPRTAMIM